MAQSISIHLKNLAQNSDAVVPFYPDQTTWWTEGWAMGINNIIPKSESMERKSSNFGVFFRFYVLNKQNKIVKKIFKLCSEKATLNIDMNIF